MQYARIYIAWFISILPALSEGQTTIQNGTVVLNGKTTQVSINNTLHNQGNLIQEGTLYLTGDLLNENNYQVDQGTLVLEGENQKITSKHLSVNELQIRNRSTKILHGIFEVNTRLVLSGGQVIVPEDSKLILNDQANIQAGQGKSYIQGFLYHRGVGKKFFPIGNEEQYAPITLNQIEGESPVVGIQYQSDAGQPYWQTKVMEGDYSGSPITLSFLSQNPDYFYYSDQLVVQAFRNDESVNSLGARSITVDQSRITLESQNATTLPLITVGFVVDRALEDVFVPTGFSPEALDPNDQRVKVYGRFISLENFQFGIQDSWGRWVYRTTSLEEAMAEGWPSSSIATSSTIFRYVLTGKFISGTSFQRSDVIMKF